MNERHDPLTIRLHWVTVVLVLALLGTALTIDLFPKGAPRWNARSVHMLLGLTLAAVVVWRIRWRVGLRQTLPTANAAKAVHRLLYGLLVVVLLLGVANAWVRGDHVFQLFEIPAYAPGNKALRQDVGMLHEYGAYLLLSISALHGLAALFHHVVRQDGVLRRMLPR